MTNECYPNCFGKIHYISIFKSPLTPCQTQLQQNQAKLSPNSDALTAQNMNAGNLQTAPKVEQKPVECNLCHRKFKNIPALNGHMRLHGGYFKKDAETKKCDKKETPGPPLQTASVGVLALIEEKIINKRSKDLKVRTVTAIADHCSLMSFQCHLRHSHMCFVHSLCRPFTLQLICEMEHKTRIIQC